MTQWIIIDVAHSSYGITSLIGHVRKVTAFPSSTGAGRQRLKGIDLNVLKASLANIQFKNPSRRMR